MFGFSGPKSRAENEEVYLRERALQLALYPKPDGTQKSTREILADAEAYEKFLKGEQ